MPIAAMRAGSTPLSVSAARAQASWLAQISSGSCSTQPGYGKYWGYSRWQLATAVPVSSNTIARELVVPWSRARM
jgi:hypothetical protein